MSRLLTPADLAALRGTGPGNWSADGHWIAFTRADRQGTPYVWVCPATGGAARRLCDRPAVIEPTDGTDRRDVGGGPRWSPREPRVAFPSGASTGEGTSVWTCSLGQLDPEELTRHVGDDRTPRWAPTGDRLAFVTDRDGRDDIQLVRAGGGAAIQLTYDRFDNTDLDWSPDGAQIVFISQRSDLDPFSNNLCIVSADGDRVRQLTYGDTSNDRSPRWSPDGRTIAFISNRGNADDLWLIDADSERLRRLTDGPGECADPQWSPDGRWLAYTEVLHGDVNVWLMSAGGGPARKLAGGGVNRAPRWSPDGTRLLYVHSGPETPADLWIVEPFALVLHPWHVTDGVSDRLDNVELRGPVSLTYASADSTPIEALLYEPSTPNGAGLLWVHGGPNDAHLNGWEPMLQYLVQRGYTVLAPNYRGSTGYGKAFMEANIGPGVGVDVDDWLAGAEFLRNLDGNDSARLGIIGHSAGGYATLLMLGLAPSVFAVGVARSAPTNWASYWEWTRTRWTRRLRMKLMGQPSQHTELYVQRSPIAHVQAFHSPVLLMHGAQDQGVPSRQATEMHAALLAAGKVSACQIYPDDGHELAHAEAIIDAAERIEKFLGSVLLRTSVDPGPGRR